MADGFTSIEKELSEIYADPVLFAKLVLNIEPRWYQAEMLRDPSKRKVIRAGRRIGKSTAMAIDMIHYCFTNRNVECLVAAPYDTHVEAIFEEARRRIRESPIVSAAVVRDRKNPQRIEFGNGSLIKGFTAGTRSGAKGDSTRGQRADRIYIDEADRLSDEDIDSIYGIAMESPHIVVWAASTPTGRRGTFWKWCNSPDVWREFHYPSHVNPNWNEDMEKDARATFTEDGYAHEILAEFGTEVTGVYPKEMIDAARRHYQYYHRDPGYHALRTVGVDFDKYGAASQIVVVEYDEKERKFKVINRTEIPRSEYTYDNTVKKIIRINEIFNPEWIYVDAGQGEYQIETLHKYGLEHPETGLHRKVKRIHFGDSIEILDPFTKQKTKQPRKPFMVNMACIALERDMVVLSDEDTTLWKQLENYSVVKISASGQPVYTSTQEHAHDAWVLAMHAMVMEHPELMEVLHKPEVARKVISIDSRKLFKEPVIISQSFGRDYDVEPPVSQLVRHSSFSIIKGTRGRSARPFRRSMW